MKELNQDEFKVVLNSLDELERMRRTSYKNHIDVKKVEDFVVQTLNKEGFKIDPVQVQEIVQRQIVKKSSVVVNRVPSPKVPSLLQVGCVMLGAFTICGILVTMVVPIILMGFVALASLFS